MPGRALEFLTARRTRLVLTWLVLLAAIGHRGVQAWINFRVPERPDRNDGHTSIDFGGQWMMGRLLVLAHGRDLYSRERHLEVAREAYSHEHEATGALDHDAERLVSYYPGTADDPIGGPLYPPIHAFVMAPFGLISDPYVAYRVAQAFLLGCMLIAGAGVRYLSRGRWWWSAATAFLLLYPGCRGGIDLGQNSPISITLLIWGWAFIVRGRPGWGGFLWGLLAFKPVWAVSFLAALLLLRQWRAAIAMAATGAGLVLLTLPIVGLQAWFDWLHIGQLAAQMYLTDRNWIFLSRDLFGVPRRIFLEFHEGIAVRDRPIAAIIGWALWGFVATTTIWIAIRSLRLANAAQKRTGPLPALVLLGAWLCTYRFMYYDALLAAVGGIALMTDPTPFFRRSWWPFASLASIFVGIMLLIENVTSPLNVEVTASVHGLTGKVTASDGSTKTTAPTIYIASGDDYPWDTAAVFALWLWCVFRVGWRANRIGDIGNAAKIIERGADVRSPNQ
jgi:arabinofuranan 3-O-arabinosyltransferase